LFGGRAGKIMKNVVVIVGAQRHRQRRMRMRLLYDVGV